MKSFLRTTIWVVTIATLFGSFAHAQKKEPREENKNAIVETVTPPRTIDFQAQLGSDSYVLDEVGEMIDDGRTYADARSLLGAAMVLFMEENATGKKASITAMDLLEEATILAQIQNNPEALKACADVWSSDAMGANNDKAAELAAMATDAKEEIAATRGSGEKVVDIRVENYSERTVYIYIDGEYQGYVDPGYYIIFTNIGLGLTTFYGQTDYYWSDAKGDYTFTYYEDEFDLQSYDLTDEADFAWSVY
jgi:hypothetical protein